MNQSNADEPATPTSLRDRSVVPGNIAARLDRLPIRAWQWKGVLITQLFWAGMVMMDVLVLRLYPVVWEPLGTFNLVEYGFLVGFSNGLGPLIGVLLLGPLADRFGRKKIMIVCCFISAASVPPLGFVTDYWLLLPVVTLTGVGVGGALVTAPAYAVEIAPPQSRNKLMLGGQLLGFVVLAFGGSAIGVALLPGNPGAYIATFSVIAIVLIPIVWLGVPESPRWLEAHGRLAAADRIVRRVEASATAAGVVLAEPSVHRVSESGRVPIGELFRGLYLKRTLTLVVVWFLIYVGINYGWQAFQYVYLVARGIPLDQILPITLISGFGAVGAIVLGIALGERVERKTYVLIATATFAIAAALYFFFGDSVPMMYFASILAGFGLTAVLTTMYNYTAVAFPTRIRSTGITFSDGIGHIGAVMGATVAGAFYTATAGANYIGWFVWVAVVGALLPGLILYIFGDRQSKAVLEEVSR